MSNFIRVMSKTRKHYPSKATEYSIVCSSASITIFKDDASGNAVKCKTFDTGDVAELDSYNLTYTGVIRKITPNTVTVEQYPGTQMSRTKRLSMYEFCWRNWNFDAVETENRNSIEMMYI